MNELPGLPGGPQDPESLSRARRKLKQGDILFSMVRPYLENIAYVEEKYDKAIASTGFS